MLKKFDHIISQMLKNTRGFQKQTAQLMEGKLEGDVLCRAGAYQLSEVLSETLDLSPALQKGQGRTMRIWMAQTPPKSWEFEPDIQLLLGVNFQVSDPGAGSIKRVSGTSALCAELHLLLVRGLKPWRWILSSGSSSGSWKY